MAVERLPARLIPTSGIRGDTDKETRATSVLLSVLGAVREFRGAVLRKRLGAPAGPVKAFVEVTLKLRGGEQVRPDGLVEISRAGGTWTALFEVKTGRNELNRTQIEQYLDAAIAHKFDAVVTISNQIMPATNEHPVRVDGRKLKKVKLHHISWVALLTEAVVAKNHRGVADRDQAWILGELIAYLEHANSGVMQSPDMGPHWASVRESARGGTPPAKDEGAADVVARWDEFSRYLCLHLGRELGVDVQQVLSSLDRKDPAQRRKRLVVDLAEKGTLQCTLRVPSVIANIDVTADLKTEKVSAALDVNAPSEGKPRTRVNWLVRQLRDQAPGDLLIDTYFKSRSGSITKTLEQLAGNPDGALLEDRQVMPRAFRITLTRPMGTRRRDGARSFGASVMSLVDEFHDSVAQNLRAWTARGPRLPKSPPPGERFVHRDGDGPLQISRQGEDSSQPEPVEG